MSAYDNTAIIDDSIDFSALIPSTNIRPIVKAWLQDDIPNFDFGGLCVGSTTKTANLWMKSPGVFAGRPFFDVIFSELGCNVSWSDLAREGEYYSDASSSRKILLAQVCGPVNQMLRGERTALNTISRCSGVATAAYLTRRHISKTHPEWKGTVAGTRKTTPGSFRLVEKYALLVGGVDTHRFNMSQMTMLKDNHIWSVGSIAKAVQVARRVCGFSHKLEVECQSLEEAVEASQAGADIVMLDNYEPVQLKVDAKAIKQVFPSIIIEVSGGITLENVCDYVCDDVDVISMGSLTQGYECIDYSLKVSK